MKTAWNLIALIVISISLHAKNPFHEALKACHTLTFRNIDAKPNGSKVTSIAELVRTIFHYNKVPNKTVMHINGHYYMVHSEIEISKKDPVVCIFSRGYAKTTKPGTNDNFIQRGAAAKAAHVQYLDRIIPPHLPLISFDYDDSKAGFAFGQNGEIETLKTIYHAVLYSNPQAHIILMGDCRGAKVALELATQHPPNLKALILMAPFISGRELTNNIAHHNLKIPFGKHILHTFFRLYFSSYRPDHDNLVNRLHTISKDLPIYIAHRRNDQLVSMETINTLIKTFKKSGNKNVSIHISEDASEPHSKLTGIPEIQKGIREFIDHTIHRFNNS